MRQFINLLSAPLILSSFYLLVPFKEQVQLALTNRNKQYMILSPRMLTYVQNKSKVINCCCLDAFPSTSFDFLTFLCHEKSQKWSFKQSEDIFFCYYSPLPLQTSVSSWPGFHKSSKYTGKYN